MVKSLVINYTSSFETRLLRSQTINDQPDKVGRYFDKMEEKDFNDQFWKEFCDFCEKFTCLAFLLFIFYVFDISPQVKLSDKQV